MQIGIGLELTNACIGGASGNTLASGPSPNFIINNRTDTGVARGIGPNTYTCSTARYIQDFEGLLKYTAVNCPAFVGLRNVTNLLTQSEFGNGTADAPGKSADVASTTLAGYAGALHAGGGNPTFMYKAGDATVGAVYIFAADIQMDDLSVPRGANSAQTGDATKDVLAVSTSDIMSTYIGYYPLGNNVYRLFWKSNRTATGANCGLIQYNTMSGKGFTATAFMQMNVAGSANQNPSEYVATTANPVTTWKDYANPYTVDGNGVVTDSGVRTPLPATYLKAGVLSHPAGTNLISNSIAPATQSVTVTAVSHTLKIQGNGTATLSGVGSGSVTGTSATDIQTLVFTPTAGSLTITLTGSITAMQLITGADVGMFALSSAATTTFGATSDGYVVSGNLPSNDCCVFVEAMMPTSQTSLSVLGAGSTSDRVTMSISTSDARFTKRNASVNFTGQNTVPVSAGVYHKIVGRLSSITGVSIFIDGVKGETVNADVSNSTATGSFELGTTYAGLTVSQLGYIKSVRIYNTALSDAECIRMTT